MLVDLLQPALDEMPRHGCGVGLELLLLGMSVASALPAPLCSLTLPLSCALVVAVLPLGLANEDLWIYSALSGPIILIAATCRCPCGPVLGVIRARARFVYGCVLGR